MVIAPEQLLHMSADELREVVQSLLHTVTFKQATIDKLTHENAYLKRLKFAAQSERFSAEQRSLLEETLESPRVLRRLQPLRRWSHEQEIKSFFPRSARTRCAHGA